MSTRSSRAANARYWKKFGNPEITQTEAERQQIAENRVAIENTTGVGITHKFVRKDKKA